MKASELFCRMWDAPYQHGAKYSGSWAVWNWEEENALIISFQQTVQDKDWVQNFKVWAKETVFGTVHAGFWQQFQEVYGKVFRAYITSGTQKKIIVCGWSQGAVLAYFFYKMILVHLETEEILNKTESKCVLFGMPNFLKKQSDWDKSNPGNVIQFTNDCDLFTRLPLGFKKPDTKEIIFGDRFNLPKAVLNIRKYHTSYIYFDGAEEANVEV